MSTRVLKVGTRGSELALVQTRRVRGLLSVDSEEVVVRTDGDVFADRSLRNPDAAGFFTKQLDELLLKGAIDLAVHSLKDLPTAQPEGVVIGAMLERGSPSDVLLVRLEAIDPLAPLGVRRGANVGTSSARRAALLARHAPDVIAGPIRGNVPTRVAKALCNEYDALILARAGLERLALEVAPLAAFDLNPEVWICAPGQGVIAVSVRTCDAEARAALAALDHPPTRECATLERECLRRLGAGCKVPLGAYARPTGEGLELTVAAPRSGAEDLSRFAGPRGDALVEPAVAWLRGEAAAPVEPARKVDWLFRPASPW